jgi:hypothetical protein
MTASRDANPPCDPRQAPGASAHTGLGVTEKGPALSTEAGAGSELCQVCRHPLAGPGGPIERVELVGSKLGRGGRIVRQRATCPVSLHGTVETPR